MEGSLKRHMASPEARVGGRRKRKRDFEEDSSDEEGGRRKEVLEKKRESERERETPEEEAQRLRRTVFLGNLPKSAKKKAIVREFTQFGTVESLRIRSVPLAETKMPRKAAVIVGQLSEVRKSCNAYLVFKEEESATAALQHNGKELFGHHIRVDHAAPSSGAEATTAAVTEYDRTRSVFIGNLPYDVEEEELYQLFGNLEALEEKDVVEAVRVIRDRHSNLGRGIAFVLFKTKKAARNALNTMDIKLRDRLLRITRPIPGAAQKNVAAPQPPVVQDGYERRKSQEEMQGGVGSENDDANMKTKVKRQPWEGLRSGKPGGKAVKEIGTVPKAGGEGGGFGRGNRERSTQSVLEAVRGGMGKGKSGKRPAVAARKFAQKASAAMQAIEAGGGRTLAMGGPGRGRGGAAKRGGGTFGRPSRGKAGSGKKGRP